MFPAILFFFIVNLSNESSTGEYKLIIVILILVHTPIMAAAFTTIYSKLKGKIN